MTDPQVRLSQPLLQVASGSSVATEIVIRNVGPVVDGYDIELLGDGVAEWAHLDSSKVSVYPDTESSVHLTFSPDTTGRVAAGSHSFGILVVSVVDQSWSTVVEGTVVVDETLGIESELRPAESRGRWRGKYGLTVTNLSNRPVHVLLEAVDSGNELAYLLDRDEIDLVRDESALMDVRVKSRNPTLRGPVRPTAFSVRARIDDPGFGSSPMVRGNRESTAHGTFVRVPILGRGVVLSAVAALVVLTAGVIFAIVRTSPPAPAGLASAALDTPDLTVTATDARTVVLAWSRQYSTGNFRVHSMTPDGRIFGVSEVDGAQELLTVSKLTPQTEYCFSLQAVAAGRMSSALSDNACATTPAASPVSVPTSTQQAASRPTAPKSGSTTTQPPKTTTVDSTAERGSATQPARTTTVVSAAGPGEAAFDQAARAATEAADRVAVAVADLAAAIGRSTAAAGSGTRVSATPSSPTPVVSSTSRTVSARPSPSGSAPTSTRPSPPRSAAPSVAQGTTVPTRAPRSGNALLPSGPIVRVEGAQTPYPFSYQGVGYAWRTEHYFDRTGPAAPAGKKYLTLVVEVRNLQTDRPIQAPFFGWLIFTYPCREPSSQEECWAIADFETDFFADPSGRVPPPRSLGSPDAKLLPDQPYQVVVSALVDESTPVSSIRVTPGIITGDSKDAGLSLADVPPIG